MFSDFHFKIIINRNSDGAVAGADHEANGHAAHYNFHPEEHKELSAWSLFQLQFQALMTKRALHHTRNYTALLVEVPKI